MSEAKVRGRVHLIEPTKTFGAKGFRKRLVVLEQENGRFPNFIPVEFTREGCDSVDQLSIGDEVEVSYVLTGRKWQKDPSSETKYFLSAEAVSFKKVGDHKASAGSRKSSSGGSPSSPDSANEAFAESYDEGDIPF
jgi:hypothetical protein